jgi:DNA-binding PucR family transcriptional regulator
VATRVPAEERLGTTLEPRRTVIERYPALVTTVQAFTESGLSSTATTPRLQIHQNTVGYRLGRWEELTGCHSRSSAGLIHSLAVLELYGLRSNRS